MKTEQSYKEILESLSDGVFTVDESWRITSFNRAAQEITGIAKDEAIGQPCSEVFRSNLCGENCALKKTIDTGISFINQSCYFINSLGERVPVSLSTAILKDEEGRILGGAESFRDLREIESLKKQLKDKQSKELIKSNNSQVNQVLKLLKVVAPTKSTILINGETGTGKELLARSIHNYSANPNEPFIGVNCGGLPEGLLESLLFGHVKGAFTGASESREGLFSRAKRGSLFLDEIGDISGTLQVRLLRVLQEGEFESLGSNETKKTEARIIVATHKNLKEEIKAGRFREDLYYRLNVINLNLPPLRERKEDLPLLCDQFIKTFNKSHQKSIQGLSPEVFNLFLNYSWPGNIRELQNVVERGVLLSTGSVIEQDSLPKEFFKLNHSSDSHFYSTKADLSPKDEDLSPKDKFEKKTISEALNHCRTKDEAAKALNMHRTTLFRKIKKYQIK